MSPFHVYIGLDQKAGLYLGVAQLVGRVAWAHEVGGSNPPHSDHQIIKEVKNTWLVH